LTNGFAVGALARRAYRKPRDNPRLTADAGPVAFNLIDVSL
jgi:hypothetical protein